MCSFAQQNGVSRSMHQMRRFSEIVFTTMDLNLVFILDKNAAYAPAVSEAWASWWKYLYFNDAARSYPFKLTAIASVKQMSNDLCVWLIDETFGLL